MDIELDDGRSAFARVIVYPDENSATEMWKRTKLFAELSILQWLEANASDVPVPRILAFDDANHLLITTFMSGLDATHAYPRLSASSKVSLLRLPQTRINSKPRNVP
jgi:aminoglycoside phosphotransferase